MSSGSSNHQSERAIPHVSRIVDKFSYIGRALQLIWTSARGWTVAWVGLLLLRGLLPALTVYLTKVLIDNFTAVIGAGLSWESVQPVLVPGVVMGLALLLSRVLQGFITWMRTAQAELVQDRVKKLIHDQAGRVDLEFYDTPAYFDEMSRANSEADSRSMSILSNMGGIIQNMVTLVGLAGLLLPYGLWLPVLLFVSTLPAFWIVIRHNRRYYAWWRSTTEKRRWVRYFDTMLTQRWSAPEVRLFGLSEYFQEAYRELREELRYSKIQLMRRQGVAGLGASTVALIVTVAAVAWMGRRALRGLATIGDVVLFYQAFNQGQSIMRTLLSNVGQLYSDALFLEHLFNFLAFEPEVQNPENPVPVPTRLREGIHVREVSFRYPGSEQLALQQFSLFIPAGKIVAIVGPNGAGKSTFIKLLCRFYDPEEGAVLLDGVDIRRVDVEKLWRHTTVLFQFPLPYSGTVAESIAMGNVEAESDLERIKAAARAGGAHEFVMRLPKAYETMLGKQFSGGVDLSGGQWQRVALARAFYRQAPLVLLDEPTSFMDSWAETRWLQRFRQLMRGRTAVIVTHRFTTAMRADLIYVMDEGRIVERGSHDELLAQQGLYAASWAAQTRGEEAQEVT